MSNLFWDDLRDSSKGFYEDDEFDIVIDLWQEEEGWSTRVNGRSKVMDKVDSTVQRRSSSYTKIFDSREEAKKIARQDIIRVKGLISEYIESKS